jgi:hypothetical protein
MVVTSVVEGLNLLEVVKAERVVAQVSLEYAKDGKFPKISFAGSHFDGLRVGSHDVKLEMNPSFMTLRAESDEPLQREHFQTISRKQGQRVIKDADPNTYKWVHDRFSWMDTDPKPGEDRCVLCSLVNGLDQETPGKSFGHVLEIPEFGRIFLGEFFVSCGSVSLSMIRAELGCNTEGLMNVSMLDTGGRMVPP